MIPCISRRARSFASFTAAMLCSVALIGCGGSSGPSLSSVSGTVTLDGQPLEGATVTFIPAEGRSSTGVTDANGNYTLKYSADQDGALPGQHQVTITTERALSGGEGDQPLVEAREEILPAKYHSETELTADVSEGSDTENFDLKSE